MRCGFWSAEFSSQTGQNKISSSVLFKIPEVQWEQFLYVPGIRGFFSWSSVSLRLLYAFLFCNLRFVYVVASRSNLGFLRDLPALFLVLFRGKLIIHIHGSDVVFLLERSFLRFFARFFYLRATLIVPSSHLSNYLAGLGFTNVFLIENFSECLSLPLVEHQPSSGLEVIWNSNIMASKGVISVIEGCELFVRNGGVLRLTLLGRVIGDHICSENNLMSFLQDYVGAPWFNFVGEVDYVEVSKFVSGADVVALPSLYPTECQPLALLQAMVLGKVPVICDTPALRATVGTYPSIVVEQTSHSVYEGLRSAHLMRIEKEHVIVARGRFSFERFHLEFVTLFYSLGMFR